MSKLTRQQKAAIASALYNAKAARAFIHGDRIAVCIARRENVLVAQSNDEYRAPGIEAVPYEGRDGAKWTIDYVRTLTPISKAAGSPLAQLDSAIRGLESMLNGGAQ